MKDIYNDSILLIGPPNVGKREISTLLSEKLNLPIIALEDSCNKYYSEIGYDKKVAEKLKKEKGLLARYQYLKEFEAHHVIRFLQDLKEPAVIKFQASQTVYEEQNLYDNVFKEMKKFKNIILLLPDVDLQDCWTKINKNGKVPVGSDLSKLNWHIISNPCNSNLATNIIYICGRNKEEVVKEILSYIKKN